MKEAFPDSSGGAGDRHGHVLTPHQASYRSYGFVTDQIWYRPVAVDPSP